MIEFLGHWQVTIMQFRIFLRSVPCCYREPGSCGRRSQRAPALISSPQNWHCYGPCLNMAQEVTRLTQRDACTRPWGRHAASDSFDPRLRSKAFPSQPLPARSGVASGEFFWLMYTRIYPVMPATWYSFPPLFARYPHLHTLKPDESDIDSHHYYSYHYY